MSAFQMKYIIIDSPVVELPIVFSGFQQHAEVARAMGASPDKIVGAGFCHIGGKDELGNPCFVCYGESISLKVKSREDEDSKVLNRMFGVNKEY